MSGDTPQSPGAGRAILEALAQMESRLMAAIKESRERVPVSTIASDADLDGQYGNPEVRKDPTTTYWPGPSFVGRKFSECPPEYLDALASLFDWKAGKEDEKTGTDEEVAKTKKYARYARTDAARARGWAARLRAGWKLPEQGDGW